MGFFDWFNGNKTLSPTEIKEKNNKFLKKIGVTYNEHLPCIEYDSESEMKDVDSICKRAIACLLSIQVAGDVNSGNSYEESKEMFGDLLKVYGVENHLLDIEKRIFENKFDSQDLIDVDWEYECYWALVWALGLIDSSEFKIPDAVCDCIKAVSLVSTCESFDEFKNKVRIRTKEEILSMLDLYYRYHWACVQKRINPKTNIGKLNPDVVVERRRGLEWLFSEFEDWHYIPMNT